MLKIPEFSGILSHKNTQKARKLHTISLSKIYFIKALVNLR